MQGSICLKYSSLSSSEEKSQRAHARFLTKSRMYFPILYASLEVKFPVYKIFLKHEYLNFIIDFRHLTFKPKYFNLRWNVI